MVKNITKNELIKICLQFPNVYEDYPFDLDPSPPESTATIRHKSNNKIFALVSVHEGRLMILLKCNPNEADIFRQLFKDVTAGYHMNKTHWNSVYPNGDVPIEIIHEMIEKSYNLTMPKVKKRS